MEKEYIIGKMLNKAYELRTPLVGTMEINTICNFDCIHCYLKGKHDVIMNFADASRIMDEIKDAGTLFLNLTGGEVFAHPQFEKIYKYAIEKGFVITVLTNASLLNKRILGILKENPPRKIEITIYGITSTIFQSVTCSNRSPEEILENILQLKTDGHNVLLKMMVLKENRPDFQLIKDFRKLQ